MLVHRSFDESPRMAFARHEISRDKMCLGSQLVLSVEQRSLTNELMFSTITAKHAVSRLPSSLSGDAKQDGD